MAQCQVGEEKCPLAIWCLANEPINISNIVCMSCLRCTQRYISVFARSDGRSANLQTFPVDRWPKCLGETRATSDYKGQSCLKCFKEDQ